MTITTVRTFILTLPTETATTKKPYLKKNYLLKPPIAQGYFLQANKCPVIRGRIKIIGIISVWKPSGIENDPWGIIDTNARWKLTCYWKNGFENDSNT